jgi:hypothetical protein
VLWSAFLGSLAGAVVAVLLLVGAVLIWDNIDRHRQSNNQDAIPEKPSLTVERFLESHLEEMIVANFSNYFPTLRIYPSKNPSE